MLEAALTLSPQEFRAIADLVYTKTGIVLAEHKHSMVYSRLARRLRQLELPNFSSYLKHLSSPGADEELSYLINAITTNLTSFFREAHHFTYLNEQILTPLAETTAPHDKTLRIWSAGCSSGAEPYSIAMVVSRWLKMHPGWSARILATDIDTNMLERGRLGRYRLQDAETIPPEYHEYFVTCKTGEDAGITIKDSLKKMIVFNPLNLLGPWPMKKPFHIIFCRNVVIYFDKPTQRTLFARFRQQIEPDGTLFIGHSENLSNVSNEFRSVGKTVYRPV